MKLGVEALNLLLTYLTIAPCWTSQLPFSHDSRATLGFSGTTAFELWVSKAQIWVWILDTSVKCWMQAYRVKPKPARSPKLNKIWIKNQDTLSSGEKLQKISRYWCNTVDVIAIFWMALAGWGTCLHICKRERVCAWESERTGECVCACAWKSVCVVGMSIA